MSTKVFKPGDTAYALIDRKKLFPLTETGSGNYEILTLNIIEYDESKQKYITEALGADYSFYTLAVDKDDVYSDLYDAKKEIMYLKLKGE